MEENMSSACRPRVDDSLLLSLAARLTDRDRFLIGLIEENRVLTTSQVAEVAFDSVRRAEVRLSQLWRLRVLERFRPFTTKGSAPFHWILDEAGARVRCAELGIEPTDHPWRRDKALALATSQRLAHTVGANGFFTALISSARTQPDHHLATWWSERRCAKEWGELVRPDGYGVWAESRLRLPFLLEHDNGTEPLGRLAAKLGGYADLAAAAGRPTWVLFCFASSRREAEAHRVLSDPRVPVATTALASGQAPDGVVWRPVGCRGRRQLIDLGDPASDGPPTRW
jgi:hypothetical protein